MERWVNRDLKLHDYLNSTYKFMFKFMDITNLNWKKVVEQEIKVAQYGVPNKIRLCTSIGMNQSEVEDMAFLENNILNLVENFKPLVSSNTTAGSLDAGNPSLEEDGSGGRGE